MDHNPKTSKNTDTVNTASTHITVALRQPKVKSGCFEDTYDQFKPMKNKHDDTHIIDTQIEQNKNILR